jgi:hypothetical protein
VALRAGDILYMCMSSHVSPGVPLSEHCALGLLSEIRRGISMGMLNIVTDAAGVMGLAGRLGGLR